MSKSYIRSSNQLLSVSPIYCCTVIISMMSKPNHTRILIAGGSIAGLTLANMLERIGIDFLVLERYKDIAPDVGASIGILPNGFRILDQLGCYDAIMDLVEGADAFEDTFTNTENGKRVLGIPDATKHFVGRTGYPTIFVDRQMLLKILYDNLRGKSKVLTSKGIVHVDNLDDRNQVQVTTGDGSIFTGSILIGADGIHSTVRREMWRIADQSDSHYFPENERNSAPIKYCCIYGISKPNAKYPKFTSQNIMGSNYSFLLASGPNHRIYWFLFKKLTKTVHGLYENIPRYSVSERDALAAEHVNDAINNRLKFGEIYDTRTTATLEALPELYNPLGGQGGNSAIEDGAELANNLFRSIKTHGVEQCFTNANIGSIFQETNALRKGRVTTHMKDSHNLQALHARETFGTRMLAKYFIPRYTGDHLLDQLSLQFRPAARLDMLPVPKRPHVDLFNDERPSMPVQSKVPLYLFLTGFAVLTAAANKYVVPVLDLTESLSEANDSSFYTPLPGFDHLLRHVTVNLHHAEVVNWEDIGQTLQFLYLALFSATILLVWYIESWRYSNRRSLFSRPVIFGVLMNFKTIGVVAPFAFLINIWSTGGSQSLAGRYVPKSVAKAIVPAIFAGYVLPTALMCITSIPSAIRKDIVLEWQFTAIPVSAVVDFLAGTISEDSLSQYSFDDLRHLTVGYKVMFIFAIAYHAAAVALVSFGAGHPALSIGRLVFPQVNLPGIEKASHQVKVFEFFKYNALFAVISVVAYGVYSVYDLRFRGLIAKKTACVAFGLYLIAQAAVGPGAALVGLWWWRETCLALTDGEIVPVKGAKM
ncbi:FAD/NAD(P)-binding domain-containing protein [Plenodomus tracheiphilus IPT5]|uniref:FAD/NAD(P)-binding domain-containing protein n=1 Tax=Plenodomus tracheiphilus IPT5 TaxID=1408161 RepID=A0A6A7AUQ6_9PLEO|nr:FAD/NAD(P)-binding domain-containing protein [Plenodomus tracheiphilus IPT5]